MFNIFSRAKPKLSDLIPKNFVDIHSHVLPGIDDGAKNIDESLKMIYEMSMLGFSKIIGTPHTYEGVHNNTNKSIEKSFQRLQEKNHENIAISYASEYMLDNSIFEKIRSKSLLCLKNNYVLVEMSYISPPINLYEIIFELRTNGYIPVLAHPERYRFLHHNFKEFEKLLNHGCKFQLNLLSVSGYYGDDILKISDLLLEKNMISFVGSDAHSISHIKIINGIRRKNFESS